jgi:hypothetical protein
MQSMPSDFLGAKYAEIVGRIKGKDLHKNQSYPLAVQPWNRSRIRPTGERGKPENAIQPNHA